ncbi:hemolysin secretion D, plasmid domain protein, partial [Neisseria meningitidis]
GKAVNLTAGMNVTAEIKTGKRRVLDYLLSPLQTKLDESFRER